MIKKLCLIISSVIILNYTVLCANDETRELVKFPEMMQQHMLSNMRDHVKSLNEILTKMANDKLDEAAEIAEHRLGMSSLDSHGASHLGKFMPKGMAQAGTNMHKAASYFALKAEEGELVEALKALSKVTASCVACHSGYRIK